MTRDADTSGQRGVVVVTGGASGIGRATVDHLIRHGWKAAIIDLESPTLADVRRAYAYDKTVRIDAVDVTDEAGIEAALAEIEASFGPIEGVVNSAGIARDIHVLDTPVEVFRHILDVNVIGSFIVARAAARRMTERKRGAIVNIASISGLRGSKGRVAYGASKGAVITMSQVMANDLARHGIRVNVVAPGPVETPMVKALHTAADRAMWMRVVPMKRYARPAEMATVIAFLLDDQQSSFITGEVIAADGGFRGTGMIADEE